MSQEEFIVPLKNYNRKIKTLWTFGGLGAGKRLNQRSQRHCCRLWGAGAVSRKRLLTWAPSWAGRWGGTRLRGPPSQTPYPHPHVHFQQAGQEVRHPHPHPRPFGSGWKHLTTLFLQNYSSSLNNADDIMILIILITELLLLIQSMHCVLALCVIHCCKHFKYISWFKFSQLAYEGGHVIIPKITQLGNHTLHSSPLPKLEGERKKPLFLVGRKAEHRSHIQEATDKYKWIKRALSLCSY